MRRPALRRPTGNCRAIGAAPFGTRAFVAVTSLLAAAACVDVAEPEAPPRLVLQITVDQLRGDLPLRHFDEFGEGGFRRLMSGGAWFFDTHHAHANTETIVGHTTLATGAHPAAHGMVANLWFDFDQGRTVYNIEDPDYRLLTQGGGVDQDTEIDPTQRSAATDGRSPAAIMVSTLSDELAIATAGRAKIFGVSVKDRGAVSMAGHAGKAFWFSKQTGEFVTSTYYYDAYPEWVTRWNEERKADAWGNTEWTLERDPSAYLFGDHDDREGETDLAGFGTTFPHPFGAPDGSYYTTLLTVSPAGDALTLDFAKALIEAEQIGQDEVTDYLSVSFSSTDYVGHLFGPSSLEAEDNLLRLDAALADLLEYVDQRVGLDRTVVVLSADHGGAELPSYMTELGVPAGYVEPDGWDRQPGLERLRRRFGVGEGLIESYAHPYVYLNRAVIEDRGLVQGEVEDAVAEEIMKLPGVALAVSSTALRENRAPDLPLLQSVRFNFSPSRSGDIFIVFEPGHYINDFDGLTVATTHGSPWRYDTYVPLVFYGWRVPAAHVSRPTRTVDVAPTLARLLDLKPPSGSVGEPLSEVLERR